MQKQQYELLIIEAFCSSLIFKIFVIFFMV